MGTKRFRRTVVILLFIMILSMNIPAKIMGERSKNIDVIVVMDNSGSMAYNDRGNLRFDVVKSFIDRLHIGDSIGVLNFNTDIDVQLPITEIKENEDKALLQDKIRTIRARKDTDVLLALTTALESIRDRDSSQNTKYCILVTDGEIDPGPEFRGDEGVRKKYYRDLWLLVDQYEDNI
jgi:Mg-chelatase subunit ChlD